MIEFAYVLCVKCILAEHTDGWDGWTVDANWNDCKPNETKDIKGFAQQNGSYNNGGRKTIGSLLNK